MPTETVHLFPWDILFLAWKENKDDWLRMYRKVVAENIGYNTLSVAVPIDILKAAVSSSSVIYVNPTPEIEL